MKRFDQNSIDWFSNISSICQNQLFFSSIDEFLNMILSTTKLKLNMTLWLLCTFTKFNVWISLTSSLTITSMLFFFVTNLTVGVIKNTADDSMKVKMMTHCDYFSCDKNDHWFKNCKLKHSKKQKTFDERNKIQKKNVEAIKRKAEKTKKNKNKKNKKINKNKSKKIKTKKFYETVKVYVNHFVFAAFAAVH